MELDKQYYPQDAVFVPATLFYNIFVHNSSHLINKKAPHRFRCRAFKKQ